MNDNEFNSQISSINGKRNKYEVLFTEQKSVDKMIKKNKLINIKDISGEQNSNIRKNFNILIKIKALNFKNSRNPKQ